MEITPHSTTQSIATMSTSSAQPLVASKVVSVSHIPPVAKTGHIPEPINLHQREIIAGTIDSFRQDRSGGLKAAEREAGAQQQMAELEDQYQNYQRMASSNRPLSQSDRFRKKQLKKALKQYQTGSRLTLQERTHRAKVLQKLNACNHRDKPDLKNKHLQNILKNCCKPELAWLIPDDMLKLLASWLGSPHSVLEPSRQELIKLLSSPEELRKVIQNNPHLASGNLYNMDDVVFKSGSRLPTSDIPINRNLRKELNLPQILCDYSGMSFRGASFPEIFFKDASFSNCDMSYADFTGSNLLSCDISGADLTAACLCKCEITWCDLNKTTLTDVNFGGIKCLNYRSGQFSKTIDLLCGALAEYSKRTNDNQAAQAIRARARMLLTSRRQKEAEAAYDELMHRHRMEIKDFWLLGNSYLESADKLDEDDRERKAQLAEKAVTCFQKGWRVTDNNSDNAFNHNTLFNWAIVALRKTGPAFDWRSVLEDIKSTGTQDSRTLTWMAETLTERQEDQNAMNTLLQLVTSQDFIHNKETHLATICKTAATIGLRNKEHLTSALAVLEGATTFALDHYGVENWADLGFFDGNDIFTCWLHQLHILVHHGHCEQASNVAFEMDKAIPGALELFAGKNHKKTAIWDQSSRESKQLIKKIKATGVTFTAGDALTHCFNSLHTGHISSGLCADPKQAGMPALHSQ